MCANAFTIKLFLKNVSCGSNSEVGPLERHVRSTPNSRRRRITAPCPGCARSGLMRRSKYLLFDHLVGASEQCRRYGEAKRFGRFKVDDQLKLRRLLDWQISGKRALENFTDVDTDLAVCIHNVRIVTHQPTRRREVAKLIDRGNGCCCHQRDELVEMYVEDWIAANK